MDQCDKPGCPVSCCEAEYQGESAYCELLPFIFECQLDKDSNYYPDCHQLLEKGQGDRIQPVIYQIAEIPHIIFNSMGQPLQPHGGKEDKQ